MSSALIIIDVQNDFCPGGGAGGAQGGALAVADGDAVIDPINALIARAAAQSWPVILTQDWHPPHHASFASQHEGRRPFDTIDLAYGVQTLWPDHCIQGTRGAAFHPRLNHHAAEMIIRKGFRRHIDSYSAFFENDRITPTGLKGALIERGISRLVMAGLATDFCVAYSALDAVRLGFDCSVAVDCCRAIDLDDSLTTMTRRMNDEGICLINSDEAVF